MRELVDPTPRTGEVRIRVEAIGVNFADVMGRMGLYRDAPDIPYVPGYEVAGTVDMVAQGVTGLKEGESVLAATRFGGYSDLVCVPYRQVFRRFDWMNAQDGAALPVNYLTAYQAMMVMGSLRKGDQVLIHGAGGGVGLAALDIAKIIGAETFGTASPEKHDFLREQGLDHAIDYRHYDYEREVRALTNGNGVQLILDPLGGVHWRKNYRLLRPGGRVVHFGVNSIARGKRRSLLDLLGAFVNLPLHTPIGLMNDNRGVMGINLGRMWNEVELVRGWMEQILDWYDEALFRPTIDRVFKLQEAAAAHNYLQDRKNRGKVLLVP